MDAEERFEKWWVANHGASAAFKPLFRSAWLACEAARDAEIEAACKELEARACDAIELANVRLLRSRLLPTPPKAGE